MIELKSLSKKYGDSLIFDNVNAAFDNPAYVYGVFGPSGSGKSTLFYILFGLDQDYEGDYIFCHSNAKQMNPAEWSRIRTDFMQIVFQDFIPMITDALMKSWNCWSIPYAAQQRPFAAPERTGRQML